MTANNPLSMPEEYKDWICLIKTKIKQSQLKASMKVNYELLNLYWELGKEIVAKESESQWGDYLIPTLSKDLKSAFPEMSGFSEANLKNIRYWYKFYTSQFGLQAVSQIEQIEKLIKNIPWGHNQRIMYKCQTLEQALFYVQKTLKLGSSRNVLEHQIDSQLFERQGKAINNFDVHLPILQSDLAKQTLKDPYHFDFLTLRDDYNEKELEKALIEKITDFLLELGTGFSYLGKQVHLKVGESDFYIDLLFYHVTLHAYVVVELKTEKFKPEFIGQLNFYVTAVNKQIKTEKDNATIGILICKDKDNVVAEYALADISQPIGIAEYQLKKLFETEFKNSLPSIEDIENGLADY